MEETQDRRHKTLYVKLYPIDCLMGSINYQLEPAERCVWYELILLSALCRYPGVIADKDGRPYPHQYIANKLNVTLELLEATLRKCTDEGRIKENNESGIEITNYKLYQSEYLRQKPYRERKRDREAELQREQDDPNTILGQSIEGVKAMLDGSDSRGKSVPERTKQLWRREAKRKGITL